MTVTTDPHRPQPVDLSRNPHLTGVYAPQRDEVDVADLEVTGEIPDDLAGSYLRNGPNPRFDPIGSFVYPLDGDGMLHRITLAGGRASYSNRFVRTPMVELEEQRGEVIWSGLTDGYTPPASVVGDTLANTTRALPDINIVEHAGRLMAMQESDKPYRIDPISLATLGTEDCDGAMLVGSTAHPKTDPRTGELVLFTYSLEAPYLTWSVVGAVGTALRTPTPVTGLDAPLMIHDMALTKKYVVLFANPLVFDFAAVMRGGSLLSWEPERGTRIALIPRDGSAVRWIDTEPFWVWHFANAFDNPDGTVTVDYVEHVYPGGFAHSATPNTSALTRATCNPVSGAITRTRIGERSGLEFPRVDDRLLTEQHDRIATVGKAESDSGDLDSLWFHDLRAGTDVAWTPGVAIGEPIYIPGAEHDYWGAIGTDPVDLRSRFYLLDADNPADGPLATVELPIRVPAGLHGSWLGAP
ncbi:carotenoid oxygenase family protein [Rhodococcoides yunnanense]|uniref:carotenoid oxygenase family protein n=1 Tax=Rhodococcoides yunnanense TaxID=278209 RepID=UPI000934C02A|nr:carotenoid oxygenase family protein [Rhodococcus yunnanensis]